MDHPPPPKPFRAEDHNDNKPHLLLACTGSVATIKLPQILTALSGLNISIIVLLSRSASSFLQSQSAEQPALTSLSYPNLLHIFSDADEWSEPWRRGSAILHIELRRWADALVIAPLSANSLAKLATGIADSLILCVARAWDTTGAIDLVRPGLENARLPGGRKAVVVCPAMNTAMWLHPVTHTHLGVLEQWGVERGGWVQVLVPVAKELACGDTGVGAMRDWKEVVQVIKARLGVDRA